MKRTRWRRWRDYVASWSKLTYIPVSRSKWNKYNTHRGRSSFAFVKKKFSTAPVLELPGVTLLWQPWVIFISSAIDRVFLHIVSIKAPCWLITARNFKFSHRPALKWPTLYLLRVVFVICVSFFSFSRETWWKRKICDTYGEMCLKVNNTRLEVDELNLMTTL